MTGAGGLRDHLVRSGLAGEVATPPGNTRGNCRRLADGDSTAAFGLSDWADATYDEILAAVEALCGTQPESDQARGWIDPDAVLTAANRHRGLLREVAAGPGCVLLATGHPTGLLGHYVEVARTLREAGCRILAPLDDAIVDVRRQRGLRFVDGVGCVWSGGDLVHTHRPEFMEAMLDALAAEGTVPDLVAGDHGMAGAAIERGIATIAIADVNDPALPLAQARGRTSAVLPIDDNLAPRLYRPLTEAILADLGHGGRHDRD